MELFSRIMKYAPLPAVLVAKHEGVLRKSPAEHTAGRLKLRRPACGGANRHW